MKNVKIIALGLSVSLIGVGSFFIYDNVKEGDTQNTNGLTYRPNTGGTAVNTENNNLPLYQYNKPSGTSHAFNSHNRIVTGFENANSQKGFSRDDYNTDLMKKYLKDLSKDGSDNNGNYLILPSKAWDNRNVLFPNSGTEYLKKVKVNGVDDANTNYKLKNFLTMVVPSNSNNRNFAAAFSKFLKKSSAARRTFDTASDFLSPLQNYETTENGRCDTLSAGKDSSNSYKAMMSTLYYNTNCDSSGFGGFDLGAFLSTFFETGEREVYVSDSLTGTQSGSPVVNKDDADRLSADGNVDLDTRVTINTDIVKWLSSLTIDKLGEVPTIFQKIQDKLTLDGTQDAAAVIQEVINSSSKITSSEANELIQVMTTLVTLFKAASDKARTNGLETSFLSSTKDIFSTLVSAGQDSINELVQDLLFDDDEYNDFFIEYGYDYLSDELTKTKSELEAEIKVSENTIDFLNTELDELTTTHNNLDGFIESGHVNVTFYKNYVDKDKIQKEEIRELTLQLNILEGKQQRGEGLTTEESLKLLGLDNDLEKLERKNDDINYWIDLYGSYPEVIKHYESIKKRDKVRIDISHTNAEIKVETNKIKTKKAKLTVINRQLNHLVNMKKAESIKEYSKNVEMVDIIKLSYGLVEKTASKLLTNLNLGEIDENGDLVVKDLSFSRANLDAVRPLFHDKVSVGGINKIISFVNRIANKFTGDSLESATKLLYNLVPKSIINFVNTEFDVLGKTMSFAEGINIGTDITYGLLTAGGVLGGTGIGAGVGAGIGALIGGKTGAKIGALAGAGIGSLAGTGVGAGTAYHYFNDGNLVITKPNDALQGIFKNIEKLRNKGEATYFNLFTDGHTLIKQTYLKQLNNVFTEMAKVFLHKEGSTYENIESFQDESKQFTAWNMVGEVLKTLMLSPNILLKVLKGSSYDNVDGVGLFKKEVVDEILEKLSYSKELIKSLSKSDDDDYIDILQYVQEQAVKWFTDASFLTTNNEENPFGVEEIKIGYNPEDITLETLKELVAKFRASTGASNEVKYIEIEEKGEKDVDYSNNEELTIRFEYRNDDDGINWMRGFLNLSQEEESQKIIAANYDPIYVPIMETKFVAVVSIFNNSFRLENQNSISFS